MLSKKDSRSQKRGNTGNKKKDQKLVRSQHPKTTIREREKYCSLFNNDTKVAVTCNAFWMEKLL